MQIKIFTIPILGGEMLTKEMNVFLRSKKVLQLKEHLINNEAEGVFWCFCVRYVDDIAAAEREKGKVDYRELLDEASFLRFTALREIRKKVAQSDSVPAFAVFTDYELTELSKEELLTPETFKKVKGIGEKKMEKYAHYFLSKPPNEKSE